jgi:hypothetical protein
MRCDSGLYALFVLLSCYLCACSAALTVLRPSADEQWDVARAQVVSWSKTSDVRSVDVLLVAERILGGALESREQLVGAKSSYNSMTFLPRTVSAQMLKADEKLAQFRWFILLRTETGDTVKSAAFMLTENSSSANSASLGTVLLRAILEKLALILCMVSAMAMCCLVCCWRRVRSYSFNVTEVIAGGKVHTLASAYPIHEADVTLKLATPRVLPTLDPLAEAEHGSSNSSNSRAAAEAADAVHAIVLPDSARSKAAAKQRRFSRLITVAGDAQATSASPSAWTVAMSCRAAVAGVFFGQVASPMNSEDLENGSLDELYSSRHRHSH